MLDLLETLSAHWHIYGLVLVVVSLLAFLHMGVDKWKAKHDAWRIPEKTLWLLAIFGGGPGAYLGMKFFRHKTLHKQFRYGFPALAMLQLIVFFVLLIYHVLVSL